MAFNRVVVASDFSAGAQSALNRALELPLAVRGHISVMHVMPPAPKLLMAKVRRQAESDLLVELGRVEPPGHLQLGGGLMAGDTCSALVSHAATVKADLTVVGATGRGGRPIGHTALSLTYQSKRPLLVVKQEAAYRRILVAVELGGRSKRLISWARRLAPNAALTLVHAAPLPFADYTALAGATAHQKAQRALHKQLTAEWRGVKDVEVSGYFGYLENLVAEKAASFDLVCVDAGRGVDHLAHQVVVTCSADIFVCH
jgi:nucleotide-binding universal stress UspA family protein